jgi:hypothetical protein
MVALAASPFLLPHVPILMLFGHPIKQKLWLTRVANLFLRPVIADGHT